MQPCRIDLADDLRPHLERIIRLPTTPQRLVLRARCVLMVNQELGVRETARRLGVRPQTVRKWVGRVRKHGLKGLQDAARSGRPHQISGLERAAVVDAACAAPHDYGLKGVTKWSGRLLAKALRIGGRVSQISGSTVNRVLRTATIKPHRIAYWKRKRDPDFDRKAKPIVDLYLNPPQDGVVVCADEKPIQVLSRQLADRLPRAPGQILQREFEYVRHGTICLTAALFVHTGRVLSMITPNRPAQVFVAFLDRLHAEVAPDQIIYLICDNLNTHKGPLVRSWMEEHPGRIRFFYLPNYASWLSQIELWFNSLQRFCLELADVQEPAAIEELVTDYVGTYNEVEAHPYKWTYTGDVLAA